MAIEESLLLVNVILSIIAVAVAVYLIPRLRSSLVMGWRLMVIALAIFAGAQLVRMIQGSENLVTVMNTLFITVFIIGMFIHLIKIIQHTEAERRR